jgi:hypothetical protein
MTWKTNRRLLLYGAAAVAVVGVGSAHASPMLLTLTAQDLTTPGSSTEMFGDVASPLCGVGCVVTPQSATDLISVPSGTQGHISFSGELSTSTIGNVNILDTTAFTVANTSTTDTYLLTASLVGQNFMGPANLVAAAGSGTFNTTITANDVYGPVTYTYFDDPGNTGVAGAGNQVAQFNFPSSSGFDVGLGTSSSSAINPPDGLTYGMSEEWTYTLAPGQELVSRGLSETKTFAAPEPATLLVLGAGIFGLGVVRRRRKST